MEHIADTLHPMADVVGVGGDDIVLLPLIGGGGLVGHGAQGEEVRTDAPPVKIIRHRFNEGVFLGDVGLGAAHHHLGQPCLDHLIGQTEAAGIFLGRLQKLQCAIVKGAQLHAPLLHFISAKGVDTVADQGRGLVMEHLLRDGLAGNITAIQVLRACHRGVVIALEGQIEEGRQLQGKQQLYGAVELGEVVLPVGQRGHGVLRQYALNTGVLKADLLLQQGQMGFNIDVGEAVERTQVDHLFPNGLDGAEIRHILHHVLHLIGEAVHTQRLHRLRACQQFQILTDSVVFHLIVGQRLRDHRLLLCQRFSELVGRHIVLLANGAAEGADIGKAVIIGDGGDGLVGIPHILHRVAQPHLLQIGLEIHTRQLLKQAREIGGGEIGGLREVIQTDVLHIITLNKGHDLPSPQLVVMAAREGHIPRHIVGGAEIEQQGIAQFQLPQLPAFGAFKVVQRQMGQHLPQQRVVALIVLGTVAHQRTQSAAASLGEKVVVHADDHQKIAAVARHVKGRVRLNEHQAVIIEIHGAVMHLHLHLAAEDHQKAGRMPKAAHTAADRENIDLLHRGIAGYVCHKKPPHCWLSPSYHCVCKNSTLFFALNSRFSPFSPLPFCQSPFFRKKPYKYSIETLL